MSVKERIRQADRIGVPGGESNEPCRRALEIAGDIEIPEFQEGRLTAKSDGRTFWLLRASDIVAGVSSGILDAGTVGTDVWLEYGYLQKNVRAQRIGEAMCRFSLLAEADMVEKVENQLNLDGRMAGSIMEFPTSNPRMLGTIASARGLSVGPLNLEISGKVEAYASLTGLGRVADIVETGETARANGLQEVYEMCGISPEFIERSDNESL